MPEDFPHDRKLGGQLFRHSLSSRFVVHVFQVSECRRFPVEGTDDVVRIKVLLDLHHHVDESVNCPSMLSL